MPVESLSERPIFASEENEFLTPTRAPLSRMALAALFLGLVSALVLLNMALIAVPMMAVIVGLAAYWHISRSDSLRGGSLALMGLSLGLTFAVCAITSDRLRSHYLYDVGSQFAKKYLDTIGENKILEAFELMQPESERQVAGTSLEEHYQSAEETIRNSLEEFTKSAKMQQVLERGKEADWQLHTGIRIVANSGQTVMVTLLMHDAARSPHREVEITLGRELKIIGNDDSASWHILNIK